MNFDFHVTLGDILTIGFVIGHAIVLETRISEKLKNLEAWRKEHTETDERIHLTQNNLLVDMQKSLAVLSDRAQIKR